MRILEETKDYVIYYNQDPIPSNANLDETTFLFMWGFLIDKETKIEYMYYEKCDDNNLNKTIMKLGKNLIKKWKK